MSPSGAEFIRQVKSEITEVDPTRRPGAARQRRRLIDVRETEECRDRPPPRRQARPARLPRVAHRGRRCPTAPST